MQGNTFTFKGKNSEEFGIRVIATDVLMPPKRSKDIRIPKKDGTFYGEDDRYYDVRDISIRCVLEKKISRADVREIAYWLSGRGELILWDEPDKHYKAEIWSSASIDTMPREIMREWTITFVADPFAYSEPKQQSLQTGSNNINYKGTRWAYPIIIVKNNGNTPIQNIEIQTINRR
ncbi:MAG: phage tail family protein [Tissierellia bacterium]|nr:phage tail family protein [Tissierellia bacterium]